MEIKYGFVVWPATNRIRFLIRRVTFGSPPSTRVFVLGLFASMLFPSKELFFLEPSSYRRATRFNTRQNLPFGCRPRQRSRPQAFSSTPQPWREVRQSNKWVPGSRGGTTRAGGPAIRHDNKERRSVWQANRGLGQT